MDYVVNVGFSNLVSLDGTEYGEIIEFDKESPNQLTLKVIPTDSINKNLNTLLDYYFTAVTNQQAAAVYYSKNKILDFEYWNYRDSLVIEKVILIFEYDFVKMEQTTVEIY